MVRENKKKIIKKVVKFILIRLMPCKRIENVYDLKKCCDEIALCYKYLPSRVMNLYLSNGFIFDSKKYAMDMCSELLDKLLLSKNVISLYYLVLFIFHNGLINNSISQKIMYLANYTNDKDWRYWITMNISSVTFNYQKGFYEEYYSDRRMLLKKIAEEYHIDIPEKCSKISKKKLLIVTFLLAPTKFNSVQRVAMMIKDGLSSKYDEIAVLSTESRVTKGLKKNTVFTNSVNKSGVNNIDEIQKLFGKTTKVMFSQGSTIEERFQDCINNIYKFNPTTIIDISDEYSPMSYYYNKDFFVVYLPLRDYVSSSFFSCITGGRIKEFKDKNDYFKCIDIHNIIEWIFPEYIPDKGEDYTKSDLGLNNDDFVIISIGNNSSGTTEDYYDNMCTMISHNTKIVWLLVGTSASEYAHNKYGYLFENKKIIEHGFEENLYGLCAACDVVVRPNITGGSGGTAIAAMRGLPIAMTSYICDATRWLGNDYSRLCNFKEVSEYVELLYSDRELYYKKKIEILNLVRTISNNQEHWNRLHFFIEEQRKKWVISKDV